MGSVSVRGGLSQRQGETNLEPWGVTYKILLLFIYYYYLLFISHVHNKKRKKKKESKRTDALEVAKMTRALGGSPEGSAGPGSESPARPTPGLDRAWPQSSHLGALAAPLRPPEPG